VVFAHPERYHYLLRDFRKFEPLYESGMIFQSNLLSFAGYYGPEVQRAAKHLLKSGMIRMLGTDAHKMEHLVRIRDLKRSQEYAHLMEIPLLLPD
jgi:protein-tyrosine phosphatase